MVWKLVNIEKSDRALKKYMAHFSNTETGQTKTVHFGASGYTDFTMSKDPERAALYRQRHAKDLTTSDARTGMSPGALSYYVLWTSPSFAQGIRNFKNRFHL